MLSFNIPPNPMNLHARFKKNSFIERIVAVFILAQFISVNSFVASSFATTPILINPHSRAIPFELSRIEIPSEMGEVRDTFRTGGRRTVILIQDAHSIPDAQRNIYKLIEYLQKTYGIDRVALEGASSELDPQIFQSFPERKLLRKTFEGYFDSGELAGSVAAAILNENSAVYQGVEDWRLYEEGIGSFLTAVQAEKAILKKMSPLRTRLEVQKRKVYSKALWDIDQRLQAFYRNEAGLIDVLKMLSKIKQPKQGSELAILLNEIKTEKKDSEIEVKGIAQRVKGWLEEKGDLLTVRLFNQKYQEFQTSQIAPQAFALYLNDLIKKGIKGETIPVSFSPKLIQAIQNHRYLYQMEGSRFFRQFEEYVMFVKELLFRNHAERKLDQRARRLQLLEKLIRLELNRDEWREIRNLSFVRREAKSASEFYKNAESREEAFLHHLVKLMRGRDSALLIAGGFHTEGMLERLRQAQVSYVLIAPRMQFVPNQSNYHAHMQGHVSWKNYLRVEDGKVDLHEAFVRGVRDRLLSMAQDSNLLLKRWRDQIILSLVQKGQLVKASQYTSFLDEVSENSTSSKYSVIQKKWQANIKHFIRTAQRLQAQNRLTEEGLAGLLQSSSVSAPVTGPAILSRDKLQGILLSSATVLRSELREAENDKEYDTEPDLLPKIFYQLDEPGLAQDLMLTTRAMIQELESQGGIKEKSLAPQIDEPKLRALERFGMGSFWEVAREISNFVSGYDAAKIVSTALGEKKDQYTEAEKHGLLELLRRFEYYFRKRFSELIERPVQRIITRMEKLSRTEVYKGDSPGVKELKKLKNEFSNNPILSQLIQQNGDRLQILRAFKKNPKTLEDVFDRDLLAQAEEDLRGLIKKVEDIRNKELAVGMAPDFYQILQNQHHLVSQEITKFSEQIAWKKVRTLIFQVKHWAMTDHVSFKQLIKMLEVIHLEKKGEDIASIGGHHLSLFTSAEKIKQFERLKNILVKNASSKATHYILRYFQQFIQAFATAAPHNTSFLKGSVELSGLVFPLEIIANKITIGKIEKTAVEGEELLVGNRPENDFQNQKFQPFDLSLKYERGQWAFHVLSLESTIAVNSIYYSPAHGWQSFAETLKSSRRVVRSELRDHLDFKVMAQFARALAPRKLEWESRALNRSEIRKIQAILEVIPPDELAAILMAQAEKEIKNDLVDSKKSSTVFLPQEIFDRKERELLETLLALDRAPHLLEASKVIAVILSNHDDENLAESLGDLSKIVSSQPAIREIGIASAYYSRNWFEKFRGMDKYLIPINPAKGMNAEKWSKVPVAVVDATYDLNRLNKMFLPVSALKMEKIDDPRIRRYLRLLQFASIIHLADLIQTDEMSDVNNHLELKAELLKRLRLSGFDSVIMDMGTQGLGISGLAVQDYLEAYRTELRFTQAA